MQDNGKLKKLAAEMRKTASQLRKLSCSREVKKLDPGKVMDFLRFFGGLHG